MSADIREMTRRDFVKASAAALGAGTAAASFTGRLRPARAAEESLVILGMYPLSGVYADVGQEMDRGTRLALEEAGMSVLGRPIRYITRDTEGKPDVGARRAREAIVNEGARFLLGEASSAVALAIMEVARQEKAVYFTSVGADEVTGKSCNPYTFRWSVPTYDAVRTVMEEFLKKFPNAKRWYTITSSYVFGESLLANFQAVARDRGLEHLGNDYHPLGEREYSSYVTKALAARPDAVAFLNFGADVVFSVKTAAQFGLNRRAKVVVPWSAGLAEYRQIGPDAMKGTYFGIQFYHDVDTPVARRVKELHERAYNEPPGYPAASTYQMARLILDGIQRAGKPDPAAVVKALEGYRYQGLTGTEEIRAFDHQVVKQYYLLVGKGSEEMQDPWDYADIVGSGSHPVPASQSQCRMGAP